MLAGGGQEQEGAQVRDALLVGTKPFLLDLISNPAGSVDIVDIFMWRLLGKLSKLTDGVSWHSSQSVCKPCSHSRLPFQHLKWGVERLNPGKNCPCQAGVRAGLGKSVCN